MVATVAPVNNVYILPVWSRIGRTGFGLGQRWELNMLVFGVYCKCGLKGIGIRLWKNAKKLGSVIESFGC